MSLDAPDGTPGAAYDVDLPCEQRDYVQRIYLTFMPTINIPRFHEAEIFLHFPSVGNVLFCDPNAPPPPPLGPFWLFHDESSCNFGGIGIEIDWPASQYGIDNPWAGRAFNTIVASGMGANGVELVDAYVHSSAPIELQPGHKYYAMTLTLPMCRADVCLGCGQGIELWGDHIYVAGVTAGDVYEFMSLQRTVTFNVSICAVTPPDAPRAKADFGALPRSQLRAMPTEPITTCDAVPARRSTWGSLKLLYR
jgi:hypothetical protein